MKFGDIVVGILTNETKVKGRYIKEDSVAFYILDNNNNIQVCQSCYKTTPEYNRIKLQDKLKTLCNEYSIKQKDLAHRIYEPLPAIRCSVRTVLKEFYKLSGREIAHEEGYLFGKVPHTSTIYQTIDNGKINGNNKFVTLFLD